MKFFNLHPSTYPTGTAIGFLWFVIVFLVVWLVTVSGSLAKESKYLEDEEPQALVKEQSHKIFKRPRGLSYYYDPNNRREPFLPLGSPPYRGGDSSYIEPSSRSRPTWILLGIASGMKGYYASIQDSEGKRYIVTTGSVIPSEGLMVNRISKSELEMEYLDKKKTTTGFTGSQKFIVSF